MFIRKYWVPLSVFLVVILLPTDTDPERADRDLQTC